MLNSTFSKFWSSVGLFVAGQCLLCQFAHPCILFAFNLMQSDRFFNALKGHGALCRLVVLPFESHGYAAYESIMHVLWETDRWLQKYCVSNASDVGTELDACKCDASKDVTDSENKAAAASGGGDPELEDFEHQGFHPVPRSLLW